MKVCLILMGDKLLAAKETLLCKTGPSPTMGTLSEICSCEYWYCTPIEVNVFPFWFELTYQVNFALSSEKKCYYTVRSTSKSLEMAVTSVESIVFIVACSLSRVEVKCFHPSVNCGMTLLQY